MIFNLKTLKKMMNSAYKGAGLHVARINDYYFLGGQSWTLAIEKGVFPYKARAALVELVGALPEQGESWTCTSSGNQVAMNFEEDFLHDIDVLDFSRSYKKTSLIYDSLNGLARIYKTDTNSIYISEVLEELLSGIPEEEEIGDIEGPVYTREHDLIWRSESCYLSVYSKQPLATNPSYPEECKMAKFLELCVPQNIPVAPIRH